MVAPKPDGSNVMKSNTVKKEADAVAPSGSQSLFKRLLGSSQDNRQFVIGVVIVVLAMIAPEIFGSIYWRHNFQIIGVLVIVSIFLNFLYMDAGQISFGQGAVLGASAYTTAVLYGTMGVSFPLAALAGISASLIFGLAFALPALRVQYYYLGFVTFGASLVFPELIVAFDEVTKGINGIPLNFGSFPRQTVLGIPILSIAVTVAVCGSLAVIMWLRRTVFGRALRISAFSPEAAQSLGISPGRMRSAAFLISALGAGVAGVLYAPVVGFVGPSAFNIELSVLFFFVIIVGGRGQLIGPIIGIVLIYLVPNMLLADSVDFRLLIYGGIALTVMLVFPDGIVGTVQRWFVREGSLPNLDFPIERAVQNSSRKVSPTATGETEAPPIELKGITKNFGSVIALEDVDLVVQRGEIHGLIGANGSGKTTLLNVLSRMIQHDAGTLKVFGKNVQKYGPARIPHLGVGRTFQTPRIFDDMTVWENIEVGIDARPNQLVPVPSDLVSELKDRFSNCLAQLVPHGPRRSIEVLRVVLSGAEILLLDEPAAGLSTRERAEFVKLLRRLRDEGGKSIVLVEHDLDLVLEVADRVTVLDVGKVVANGTPAEVTKDPAVRPLFLRTSDASS